MYDAIWTLAKALDELMTMKELKVEGVDCGTGRRNGPGKRSADEVLKKLLEVRVDYSIRLLLNCIIILITHLEILIKTNVITHLLFNRRTMKG